MTVSPSSVIWHYLGSVSVLFKWLPKKAAPRHYRPDTSRLLLPVGRCFKEKLHSSSFKSCMHVRGVMSSCSWKMNATLFFEYRKVRLKKPGLPCPRILFIDDHAAAAIHFPQISLYILRFEAPHKLATMRTICHKQTAQQWTLLLRAHSSAYNTHTRNPRMGQNFVSKYRIMCKLQPRI